jgi:hypothetical protein
MTKTSYFYDYYYKPFFEKIQAKLYEKTEDKIHPNLITLCSFIIVSLLYLFNITNPLLLSGGLFLYWICDGIDGIHARNTKQTSHLGEILDHCTDAYSVILITDIFKNILKITNPFFSIATILSFDVTHLLDSYTNNLELGYKYFSIDEINIILILVPFLQYSMSSYIISNSVLIMCVASFINVAYNLYKLKKIISSSVGPNLFYSNSRVRFFILMAVLNMLIPNRIIIALINILYVYIMIDLKKYLYI